MKTETQHIIIGIVGLIAIILILKNTHMEYVGYIITGLLTFLSTKNLTDKQSEVIAEETIRQNEIETEEAY